MKLYEWSNWQWKESRDILPVYGGDCGYPLVCGNYGVCSKGICFCPDITDSQSNFFRANDFRQPSLGCSLITPISCSDFRHHSLIELKDMYYFAFNSNLYSQRTELNTCKTKCLRDCSCRAALFLYHRDSTKGGCLLLKEVFSIADNQFGRVSRDNTSLFIKVQKLPRGRLKPAAFGIVSAVGALLGILIVVVCCFSFVRKRFFGYKDSEDEFIDIETGMPFRYSYDELKAATADFSVKLGEGGFGSVYEGTLTDGTKMAVKCIDGLGHAKDSFSVEVKIIGSIHHVNLVKLIGFCTKMSERFLVYEYMDNGSLDRWIFSDNQDLSLQWHIRRKIMVDIAKGLAYLHEQCSHKILHLDIKPQNILLDKNFNAKLSDFGLSKLIEKDQSRTATRMRGTPGYMAPEWLSSVITEKVDVFSFGVVMLEVLCGRKNLDWYRVEEEQHLLSLFMRKVKEDGMWEIVDKRCEDIELHKEEVIKMMKIAAWCLQNDVSRRPSMSRVIKVFDGLLPVETNLDYDFIRPPAFRTSEMLDEDFGVASPLLPSVLSGPR